MSVIRKSAAIVAMSAAALGVAGSAQANWWAWSGSEDIGSWAWAEGGIWLAVQDVKSDNRTAYGCANQDDDAYILYNRSGAGTIAYRHFSESLHAAKACAAIRFAPDKCSQWFY